MKIVWIVALLLALGPQVGQAQEASTAGAETPAAGAEAPAGQPEAATATLTVRVVNVSPKGGTVSLALFDKADYHDDDHPLASRNVPAVAPETLVTLEGLKPGLYAVKMMQDINGNGKFDTSAIGLPLEPYGFSNNAKPLLGAPGFEATQFRIRPGANTISITLSSTDAMNPPPRGSGERSAALPGQTATQ